MGLRTSVSRIAVFRKMTILTALLTTSAGVGLIIDRPKGTILEWLAIPFLVCGGALLTWAVWPLTSGLGESSPSLATRLLRRLTVDGRFVRFFPPFGIALIVLDLAYNWAVSASPTIQTEDTIVLLAAVTLLAYCFVPSRFARERDFVLLFFVFLNAILVVPLLIARLYYADLERSVDLYSWVALAPQTSTVLNLIGVRNQLHSVAGSTAPGLTFIPEHIGTQVTVIITTSCSGIYSFGIFAAAFVSFVLTEYQSLGRRIWLLLGLGFIAAYAANVLRMVVIILVGYYTDTAVTDLQNMLIAHSYAGWLIFLGWISVFWGSLFKVLPGNGEQVHRIKSVDEGRPSTNCQACGRALSPAIPATRCVCGSYFHLVCVEARNTCPGCGRAVLDHLTTPID